jgi:hypothetical protein
MIGAADNCCEARSMGQVQISLQGGNAIAIAEALQALPGFEGEVVIERASEGEVLRGEKLDRALLVVTTAATIVGLLSDGVGLVKDLPGIGEEPTVKSVLITTDGGKSIVLENATPEQIVEILKGMQ